MISINMLSLIMLSKFPFFVQISFALSLALFLVAWSLSVIQALKNKKHRILAILPITQPLLAIGGLFVSSGRKKDKAPGLLLIGALLIFWLGPIGAENLERRRLLSWVDQLESSGFSVDLKSAFSSNEPVADDENIWMSPFLNPLYLYAKELSNHGSSKPSSPEVRSGLDRYESMEPKQAPIRIQFKTNDPNIAGSKSFHRLLQNAVSVLHNSNPETQQLQPALDLYSAASVMHEFYEGQSETFEMLEDAVSREKGDYYYDFDQHPFEILLPHLGYLKKFAIALNERMTVNLILGNPESAWKDWKTLSQLLKAQDREADLLITRLVQLAQYQITINSIHVAQSLGVWDVEQWKVIENELEGWNLRKKMADAMLMEIPLLASAAKYSANYIPKDKNDLLNEVSNGLGVGRLDQNNLLVGEMIFAIDLWNAISPATLRATIHAEMRSKLEEQVSNCKETFHLFEKNESESQQAGDNSSLSFSFVEPQNLEDSSNDQSVLPSILSIYEKTLMGETRVNLARLACRLEMYRKSNGKYPDSLTLIQESGLEDIHYETFGDKGFSMEIDLPDWLKNHDTQIWTITGESLQLPEYTLLGD